jgi:hypothetical protein
MPFEDFELQNLIPGYNAKPPARSSSRTIHSDGSGFRDGNSPAPALCANATYENAHIVAMIQRLKLLKSHFCSAVSTIDSVVAFLEHSCSKTHIGIANDTSSVTVAMVNQSIQVDLEITRGPDLDCSVVAGDDSILEADPSTSMSSRDSGVFHSAAPRRNCRRLRMTGQGSKDEKFKAHSNLKELFISNVSCTTEASDILQYLDSKVTVLKLQQISHPKSRAKSFLLSIPLADAGLFEPNFLPPGVQCRDFVRPLEGRLARL